MTDNNVTPAQELRAAASKIRSFAGIAPKGPWVAYSDEVGTDWPAGSEEWQLNRRDQDVADRTGSASEHIALWHPNVGQLCADWMDRWADFLDANDPASFPDLDELVDPIVAIARAINGEVQA